MPLKFSWLRYHGEDDAGVIADIKDQIADAAELVTLHDTQYLCNYHHHTVDLYFLAQYLEVYRPLMNSRYGPQLTLVFQELYPGEGITEIGCEPFNVYFLRKSAETLQKLIYDKKLVPGDIVEFRKSKFSSENIEENRLRKNDFGRTKRLLLFAENFGENSEIPEGVINLWQRHSDLYVNTVSTYHNYNRISVYNMDTTGSSGHVLSNLFHLVKDRGSIASLRQIANCDLPKRFIAVAKFIKLVCPLTLCDGKTEILLSFKEVVLEQSKDHVTQYFNNFSAFFFNSLAKQLQDAVTCNLLEPGDFVALCHPVFDKVTAASISIQFPLSEINNVVVLKNRYKDESHNSVTAFDINVPLCSLEKESKDVVSLNKEYNINIKNFDFLLFQNFSNLKYSLMRVKRALEECGGKVTGLERIAKQEKVTELNVSRFILSYFLKIISPLHLVSGRKKAIIFLRELHENCTHGSFFRVALYDEFAEVMCSAVKKKHMIRGDIVALVNPFVFHNHNYLSKYLLYEEPFSAELSPLIAKQRIVVCKLKRSTRQQEILLSDFKTTHSLRNLPPSECCLICIRNRQNRQRRESFFLNQMGELAKDNLDNEPIKSSVTNNKDLFKTHTDFSDNIAPGITPQSLGIKVPSCNKVKLVQEIIKDKQSNNKTREGSKHNVCQNRFRSWSSIRCRGFEVFPLSLERPNTDEDMDLVSGYCSLGCHKMFVYSCIVWSKFKEPLCPNCLLKLRLVLCLELESLAKSGRHLRVLLVEKDAERFLEVTCQNFLKYQEARQSAKEALERKILPKVREGQIQKHFELELADTTLFLVKSK